jgi:hypothetical protein
MREKMKRILSGLTLSCALAAGASLAQTPAHTYTFETLSGATDTAGESVVGMVSFTTFSDENYVAITITDLSSPLKSVGQAITGVQFTTVTNAFSHSSTVTVASGQEYSISGTGAKTVAVDKPWYLSLPSSSMVDLSVFGHGNPRNSVLPALSSYAGAGGSIDGNGPHNPFYVGSVTFDVSTGSQDPADLYFRNVQINFGTGTDLLVTQLIPEPETYALMLLGLGVLGFAARRRKRRAA